jgi:polyisoprenoid-binding protein YceI
MQLRTIAISAVAAIVVAGCGEAANSQSNGATDTVADTEAAAGFDAISGEYKTDPRHRYITFSYFHQGFSRPWVRWRNWDAVLDWDAEEPEASSVSVTIDATSVDSGVDVFDEHLQGERFFDTANHPEITFESTSLTKTGDATGTMTGDLTIKGITKPVTLDVTYNNSAFSERGNEYKIGFSAKGSVNRSEFGMDYLVPVTSDEVEIVIEAEFEMPAEEPAEE